MLFRGGTLVKGRIACGCVFLLGFTAGTGLAYTENIESGVSTALGKIGSWLSEIFKGDGASSSSPPPLKPFDPISLAEPVWQKIFEATKTVVGVVPLGYGWIKTNENQEFLATFLKNFWNFNFVKNIVFNFHLTVRAWLGVLFDSDALSKFPNAFQTFKVLSKFLSNEGAQQNGDKEMINWLYLRLIVNPRKTVNVLRRGAKGGSLKDHNELKCNGRGGKKKRAENLPLGVCFICKSENKLIDHMINFLKQGIVPPVTKQT